MVFIFAVSITPVASAANPITSISPAVTWFSHPMAKNVQELIKMIFTGQLKGNDSFIPTTEAMSEADSPVIITQSEFMRRMKDMSRLGGGMNFYGDIPDSYNLVINTNHDLIRGLTGDAQKELGEAIKKQSEAIASLEKEIEETEKAQEGKKDEEITQAEKDKLEALLKKKSKAEDKKKEIVSKYADKKPVVQQLIDLALLANNMLKGEKLSTFVKRSIELL